MSEPNQEADPKQPSWKMRRIIIFSMFYLCWGVIVYAVGWGDPDNGLHRSAMFWAWMFSFLTMLSYAGWATWEDINFGKFLGKK